MMQVDEELEENVMPHQERSKRGAVDLATFDNSWYAAGGRIRRTLWYFCGLLVLRSRLPLPASLKRALLIIFGAKVGRGTIIKPNIQIKYPWLLEIGDNVWLGEEVWIDNLARVRIGDNVCLSQGAYLLTGNHDYKSKSFDLIVGPITLADGAWVGAKAIVCPGVTLGSHAVLSAGSVLSTDAAPYTVYRGNPAVPIKERIIKE